MSKVIHDKTHKELVDVLAPPTFTPNGETKLAKQAIEDGNWLGTFNIWLYTRIPEPSIIYQLRSPHALWEPGKLDISAAGHYNAGEVGLDGLRELKEELGIAMPKERVQFFTRKLFTSTDVKGRERKSVISIYLAEYEVSGVFLVPITPLIQLWNGEGRPFIVHGIDPYKTPLEFTVTADSFPFNFDDYHRHMAEFIALKLGASDAYLGN